MITSKESMTAIINSDFKNFIQVFFHISLKYFLSFIKIVKCSCIAFFPNLVFNKKYLCLDIYL